MARTSWLLAPRFCSTMAMVRDGHRQLPVVAPAESNRPAKGPLGPSQHPGTSRASSTSVSRQAGVVPVL